MSVRSGLLCLGLFLLIGASGGRVAPGAGETGDASAGARLLLSAEDGRVTVRGLFVNEAGPEGNLAYRLTVRRAGSSGRATTRQQGSFTTAPGERDTLSGVRISVAEGDCLEVALRILRSGNVVSRTSRGGAYPEILRYR